MSTRYFSAAEEAYQYVASQLDEAYGYPNEATRTQRALPPFADLPQYGGRGYLAIDAAYCEFNLPSQMLPQLLASGQVDEITERDYLSVAVPQPI